MEWTDAAAAEEARKGNQQAFRVLVERHSHTIFRLAFPMTGNEQDVELYVYKHCRHRSNPS
jgi:DNA-directed RNA polymerase specialized sigma24 family protein